MVSHQLKSMVAQNCQGYNSRSTWGMSSLGNIAENCDTCINYVRGKCVKNLFDMIAENITMN